MATRYGLVVIGGQIEMNLAADTFQVSGALNVLNGSAILGTSAATTPLYVRGASGQTNYLLAYRDESNNYLGTVGSTGTFYCESGMAVTGPGGGNYSFIARGAAGSTAMLMRVMNSDTDDICFIDQNGSLFFWASGIGLGWPNFSVIQASSTELQVKRSAAILGKHTVSSGTRTEMRVLDPTNACVFLAAADATNTSAYIGSTTSSDLALKTVGVARWKIDKTNGYLTAQSAVASRFFMGVGNTLSLDGSSGATGFLYVKNSGTNLLTFNYNSGFPKLTLTGSASTAEVQANNGWVSIGSTTNSPLWFGCGGASYWGVSTAGALTAAGGNRYIANVSDPVDPQDLATKNYVDNLSGKVLTTGGSTVQCADAYSVPCVIHAASGQGVNIFEVQNSSGTPVVYIDSDGITYVNNGIQMSTSTQTIRMLGGIGTFFLSRTNLALEGGGELQLNYTKVLDATTLYLTSNGYISYNATTLFQSGTLTDAGHGNFAASATVYHPDATTTTAGFQTTADSIKISNSRWEVDGTGDIPASAQSIFSYSVASIATTSFAMWHVVSGKEGAGNPYIDITITAFPSAWNSTQRFKVTGMTVDTAGTVALVAHSVTNYGAADQAVYAMAGYITIYVTGTSNGSGAGKLAITCNMASGYADTCVMFCGEMTNNI